MGVWSKAKRARGARNSKKSKAFEFELNFNALPFLIVPGAIVLQLPQMYVTVCPYLEMPRLLQT